MTLKDYLELNLQKCLETQWFNSEANAIRYLTESYNSLYKEQPEEISCSGEDVFTDEAIKPVSKYSKWLD